MRMRLVALCVLGRAISGVSAAATHDVPITSSATNDDQKFKIARSVTSRSIAPNLNVASTLRGSRAAAASITDSDRILKEEDGNNREEKNGQGQVEECDKDCEMHEKARKEDEKAREKAQKEVEKMAEEAAKAAEEAAKDAAKAAEEAAKDAAKAAEQEAKDAAKAAEDAAKAAEKENADVPVDVPGEDEPETIEQDTTITTPNVEKPDETTNALLVDDEAVIMAPAVNTDGQDVAANEETPAAAAKNEKDEEEPEAAGTDGPFVVVVPPTSVKEDLGDDNKAVLPPPTEDNTIFDITTENEGTTTTTTPILENEGSGISSSSSQNNKPTVADVSTNNGDGFPGPVNTDTDSGLTFSSSISGSSSPDDDGLQPVGKALLSVALAGVFVAFVAVFLLRRQRRSSSSDPAKNALAITPYSPSKDDSYFVDRDDSYDNTSDVEKQIVPVDTAASSPAQTPEKISTAHDHEDANNDGDAADGESVEEESSQSASLSFSENASNFLSMLPCQLDISPCSKPTVLEVSTDDSTSVPLPPDLRVVAAPSASEAEGEESEENFARNNTARELMRKYKMDDTVNF